MSYYDLCCRYHGRVVTISCLDGKTYRGTITKVTNSHVYIQPSGAGQFGGFSYGWGYGRRRLGFPIALAFIGGLALGTALWWI